MVKRVAQIVNLIVLILIVLFVLFIILRYFQQASPISEECTDVNALINLKYDSCYDYNSSEMIIKISRGADNYEIKKIDLIFSALNFSLSEIPRAGETKEYRFKSARSDKFGVRAYIDSSLNLCNTPEIIYPKHCESEEKNFNAYVTLLFNYSSEETISKTGMRVYSESDILSYSLVEKERIFDPECKSKWVCSGWEECIDGVQKRECIDKNDCLIPTDRIGFTKSCYAQCKEGWVCEWSDCINGYTTPNCRDINECGLSYSKPEKLPCVQKSMEKCTPDLKCETWSKCYIEYNLNDLANNVENIHGTRIRLCNDKNNCIRNIYEKENCSLSADIYTREVIINGEKYLEVYDELNDNLLARIKYSNKGTPYLNVNLYLP